MNKIKIYILILGSLLISCPALCEIKEKVPQVRTSVKEENKISKEEKKFNASAQDSKTMAQQTINNDWWDKFNDPVLKGYITKTLKDNYDLQMAESRVQQAKATARQYLGKEMPELDLGLNYARAKTSGNLSSSASTKSSYIFPLTASYEIDIWGKNRYTTIGKKKELDSYKYAQKAAYISLCSTVATVYFNIASTDRQIEIQKEIIELRKSIYEMTKQNNELGLLPTTDVIQADKSFTEAQSSIKDLQKRQSILLNQLAVLIGDSSENSAVLSRTNIEKIDLIKDMPKEISSDIVRQRPDLLKAESDMQKSKIDVSVARRDLLPSFPITGVFGFNSDSFSKSLDWDSYVASLGVGLAHSVFSGGQKTAALKVSKYKFQEMMQSYQKSILTSFQEVNDSLAALKYDTEKNGDNTERLKLERENMGVINNRYTLGAISLLDTLQYKERVYSLEKEQVQSKTDCLIDSLSVYKAVGGKI